MTISVAAATREMSSRAALPTWTITAAAAVAVLGRIPFIGHAASPDEAGFLLVGGQWNGSGASLYGNYWVDRPPLLITIFKFASNLGGLPALRLIGCVAVLLVVLGSAHLARLVGGEVAARWAAVTASALCLTPLLGGYAVNGELLAAPFVVGGLIAVVLALRASQDRRAARLALAAGVLAVCAVLVKQNFADVAVFGAVALTVAWRRGEVAPQRGVRLIAYTFGGAVLALSLFAAWTLAHGTSLAGVFDAMYPFRIHAGQVQAQGGSAHSSARLISLLRVAITAGLALILAVVTLDAVTRRRRSAVSWALLVLLAFAGASVLLGGNYWHHYLIGLIVPASVAAGLLAADGRLLMRPAIGYAVASALVASAVSLAVPQGSAGQTVGEAIKAVAQPGDTVVNLYGQADIVQSSGLASPYPHLWSLPVKTLDPDLAELNAVLSGPSAPTWLVTGSTIRSWGLQTGETSAIVARDYTKFESICGRTIYLHVGVIRATPWVATACR